MHSNFNDLKTKTMEYKELVKHHTQLIKDKNDNKWEVIETSDLEEICEAYYQAKLKLLGIGDVSNWVAIESDEQPDRVTEVMVRYGDGVKEVALFDGDGRYYIEKDDRDVTDRIVEWHRLP